MRSLLTTLKGIELAMDKECFFVHKLEVAPTLFPAIKNYTLQVYRYDTNKASAPVNTLVLRYKVCMTTRSTTLEELMLIEEKMQVEMIRLIVTDMFKKDKDSVTESIIT